MWSPKSVNKIFPSQRSTNQNFWSSDGKFWSPIFLLRIRTKRTRNDGDFSANDKINYYMASSASGQDESNPALWLATRAGKIEVSCPLGTTRRVPQEKFPRKPYNKSFIDQACSVKITGYWPRSFFLARLWTSTPSQSINTQKRPWPISSYLDLTLGQ